MRRGHHPQPQSADRHSFRMELVLEFDEAVSVTQAKEAARRIMDGLNLASTGPQQGASPSSCRLVCHDLRRSLSLPEDDGSSTQ